jgi:hypothetical protein
LSLPCSTIIFALATDNYFLQAVHTLGQQKV